MEVKDETREQLIDQAREGGPVNWDAEDANTSAQKVTRVLQLIAGTIEYQFA
jgi:hypothetical protein